MENSEHTNTPTSDNNTSNQDDVPNCKIDVNGEQTTDVSKIEELYSV